MNDCKFKTTKEIEGKIVEFCEYYYKKLESPCGNCPMRGLNVENVTKKYTTIRVIYDGAGFMVFINNFDSLPQALAYKKTAEMDAGEVVIVEGIYGDVYFDTEAGPTSSCDADSTCPLCCVSVSDEQKENSKTEKKQTF